MEEAALCFVVSGLQPRLGAREIESLIDFPLERLSERLYLARVPWAQVRKCLRKLYDCVLLQEVISVKGLRARPESDPEFYRDLAARCYWSELEGKTFAVSVRKLGGFPHSSSVSLAAKVAEGILEALKGRSKVNLSKPDVTVNLVTSGEVAVIGLNLLRARGDRYRLRSKKFKVFRHPASLTPEDAGVLVNLAGWRSPLLDPFCGSGTIVIEACLREVEAVGLEIEENVARGAYRNLRHFSCDARGHIVVGDATMLPFRARAFNAIATNPPYGRTLATDKPAGALVKSFLHNCAYTLSSGSRVALVRPAGFDAMDHRQYVTEEYPVRVHGSLIRLFTLSALREVERK